MITSEELENFDIFPKEYSITCLMKFIFYSLVSLVGFLLLFSFYSDIDFLSLITFKSISKDIEVHDYLTLKIMQLQPDRYFTNGSKYMRDYSEDLENTFFKEFVLNSYPCLIKKSKNIFNISKINDYIEEKLKKNESSENVFLEIRNDPGTEYFDEDFKYKTISYKKYLSEVEERKNKNKKDYYLINELDIRNIERNNNETFIVKNLFLSQNKILAQMKLNEISFSRADDFVIISGHMEKTDDFICTSQGELDIILIPPTQKKLVYPYNGRRGPINYSMANFFQGRRPDEKYPEFFIADRIFITLLEEECVYIPAFWWRSIKTKNIDDNIGTSKFITFKAESSSKYLDMLFNV